jgi:hypothetical protein
MNLRTGLILVTGFVLAGCLSFGGKNNDETGVQAFEKELADMLRSYRQCLEKYEEDPVKAKEKCEVYRKTVYDLAPKGVSERRERLLEKQRNKE